MSSIFYKGIFTSYGFFAVILFALGFFLLAKTRRTTHSRTDTKIYIYGIISLIVAITYFVLYVKQIKHFFG